MVQIPGGWCDLHGLHKEIRICTAQRVGYHDGVCRFTLLEQGSNDPVYSQAVPRKIIVTGLSEHLRRQIRLNEHASDHADLGVQPILRSYHTGSPPLVSISVTTAGAFTSSSHLALFSQVDA